MGQWACRSKEEFTQETFIHLCIWHNSFVLPCRALFLCVWLFHLIYHAHLLCTLPHIPLYMYFFFPTGLLVKKYLRPACLLGPSLFGSWLDILHWYSFTDISERCNLKANFCSSVSHNLSTLSFTLFPESQLKEFHVDVSVGFSTPWLLGLSTLICC